MPLKDSIRLGPNLKLTLGFRDEFSSGWNEAHGRASNYTFTNGVINTSPQIGNKRYDGQQCEIPPAAASRPGLESFRFAQNRGASRFRHVQRFAGCTGLSDGPERPLQSDLQPFDQRFELPDFAVRSDTVRREACARRNSAGSANPHSDLMVASRAAATHREHHSHGGLCGLAWLSRNHRRGRQRTFPRDLPQRAVSPDLSAASFPAGYAGTPVPAGTYYVPTSVRANAALQQYLDVFLRRRCFYNVPAS